MSTMANKFSSQYGLYNRLNQQLGVTAVYGSGGHTGDLSVRQRIKNAGSDPSVEEELAEIFGRNKIQDDILQGFAGVVIGDEEELPDDFDLRLVLKGGATVSRALAQHDSQSDPRYLRSLVQLSLLAWCSQSSLATGLLMACNGRDQDRPSQGSPVTLDGVNKFLNMVREQTASFNWRFEIEEQRARLPERFLKHIPINSDDGSLPLNILQGCLDMLTYVQHNSDTHLVKIGINGRHNSGIALLYVWAHDLLGLNLMIEESGSSDVMYGGPVEDDKQVMITIGEEDSISLLRRNSSEESRTSFYGRNTGEEVFRVTLQQHQDITISLPRPALGSGYQLMAMRGHRGPDGTVSGNFLNNILFECDSMLARLGLAYQDGIDRTKGVINLLFPGLEEKVHSSSSKTTQGDGSNTSRRVDRLAIRLSDLKEASRKVSKPDETCKDSVRCMASWLAAFSCLESPATAKDLPIHLGHLHQSAIEKVQAPITTIQRLLQHDFDDASDRCVGNTLGISWSGWTCLTTGMELPDPAGVRNGQLSVLRGTPVVDDTPRRLIVGDSNPGDMSIEEVSLPRPQLPARLECWFPDLFGTLHRRVDDEWLAISVQTRIGDEGSPADRGQTLMREASTTLYPQELLSCLAHKNVTVSQPCSHQNFRLGDPINLYPDSHMCDVFLRTAGNVVFFPTTTLLVASAGNQWARWLGVKYACIRYGEDEIEGNHVVRAPPPMVIRDEGTCPDCVMRAAMELSPPGPGRIGPKAIVIL